MPVRSLEKRSQRPSGDQVGSRSKARSRVTSLSPPPSRSTMRTSQAPLRWCRNAIARPDGLKRGEATGSPSGSAKSTRGWLPPGSSRAMAVPPPGLRQEKTTAPSAATSGSLARRPRVSRSVAPLAGSSA